MKALWLALAVTLLLTPLYPVRCVVVEDAHGREAVRLPVQPGETIAISYIHSVERTPWVHFYEISRGNRFVLRRMRFKSFGAGVPDFAPVVRRIDGWIEYAGFNYEFRQLRWNIQGALNHYLYWRGRDVRLWTLVASGTNVRIFVTFRPVAVLLRQLLGGRE